MLQSGSVTALAVGLLGVETLGIAEAGVGIIGEIVGLFFVTNRTTFCADIPGGIVIRGRWKGEKEQYTQGRKEPSGAVLTGHIVNRIDRGHGEHISGEEDVLVEDVLYALGRNQHHDRENEIHQ